MNILEKDIETLIWDSLHGDQKLLIDRGLPLAPSDMYFRQVRLGNYGIADLISVKLNPKFKIISVTVYELKKEKINTSTLLQASRYVKALTRLIKRYKPDYYIDIKIRLIGKDIDTSDNFCYLLDFIFGLEVYLYSLDLVKGLVFTEKSGYILRDEQLPELDFSISDIKNLINGKTNGSRD